MGNPIYYPPPSPAPACDRPRRDFTAEVAGALADADFYFGRAAAAGAPARRGGGTEGAAAGGPSTSAAGWGVGFRWGLPPLPAALRGGALPYQALPDEAGRVAAAGLGGPTSHGRAAAAAARALDTLRGELMLSALDPSDWDVAFGGGGRRGGGGGGGGDRGGGEGEAPRPLRRAPYRPPSFGREAGGDGAADRHAHPPRPAHPSALATALLRASAGDAAARVMEVQATLAALEGRLGALQAARRARAAATAAAGRMV